MALKVGRTLKYTDFNVCLLVINHEYVDLEHDDGSHTSFVLMDKGQIFMGRTDTIVGDQAYYSIPWSGIGINLKPDHPYALPILKCTDSCYRYDCHI